MSDDDNPYRSLHRAMRAVEILTEGESLYMESASADRLECLLEKVRLDKSNGYAEDIHKFSLCFGSAVGGVFTMAGQYWVAEFNKRIGPVLKACDIVLTEGTHGANSQWDRDVYLPRQKERENRRRG